MTWGMQSNKVLKNANECAKTASAIPTANAVLRKIYKMLCAKRHIVSDAIFVKLVN